MIGCQIKVIKVEYQQIFIIIIVQVGVPLGHKEKYNHKNT